MNDVVIKDPETGITFTYKWRDSYGWGVSFCDKAYEFEDVDLFRVAMKNCRKYWPNIPKHLEEQLNKNNQEMVDVCRSLDTNA